MVHIRATVHKSIFKEEGMICLQKFLTSTVSFVVLCVITKIMLPDEN